MKQNSNSRKANEHAREIIANIILFDLSDPRFNSVTITACEVSLDRSVCNVFYSAPKDLYDDLADAFEKASGKIRSIMSKKLSWSTTPALRFILDETLDNAMRIQNALDSDTRLQDEDTGLQDSDAILKDKGTKQKDRDTTLLDSDAREQDSSATLWDSDTNLRRTED